MLMDSEKLLPANRESAIILDREGAISRDSLLNYLVDRILRPVNVLP
jgi:hypothetical protein